MCGIAGFWNTGGDPAPREVMDAMLARLRHRGPDDGGVWSEGPLALGHRRLSILDPSPAGHQPFITEDGDGVLCQSGEIYNYRELRTRLEDEGVRFRSRSDSEVALYALHRWGPATAVPRFDGMFALAYYDRRARALYLARDRAGIVPLYLARSAEAIVFASEIKALLVHPRVPARPDPLALATQAYHERLDGPWTLFEGVEGVPSGTILRFTEHATETITYFNLLRDLDVSRLQHDAEGSLAAAAARLEERLSRSVELHLRSDAPLATTCSGGIDSGLITALARERKPDLVGYVADVEGVGGRERDRAVEVCRHLDVELRPVPVRFEDCLRLWPLAVLHNDQPLYFANDIPYLMVARAARQDGFKVLLAGEGADELLGGYVWHASTYRMWRRRRWHARLWPDISPLRTLGRVARRFMPLDMAELSRQPFRRVDDESARRREVRAAFLLDGGRRYVRQAALFRRLGEVLPPEEQAFLARTFDDFHIHLGTLLQSRNKMSMAASMEMRVPYLENELIDFTLHLPLRYKFDGRSGKRISRLLAEKRLPHRIVHAPKIGFELPPAMWNRAGSFLEGGMVQEYFRWGANEAAAVRDHLARDPGFLFALLGLELWARLYFGGASPEQLGQELVRASAA
jgi:asparagine synthase (glutamine-hydrolysing)